MPIIPFKNITPTVHPSVFLAPDAWITGQVSIDENVSIFFGVVMRGDIQKIFIGRDTNLQEQVMVHTSNGLQDCIVGKGVTVGHHAIVHGCTVNDHCIIGMGSVLLDGAQIGKNCIIGAQALVPMNAQIPEGSLAMGVPAKVVRKLTSKEIDEIQASAEHYVEVGQEYRRFFIKQSKLDTSSRVNPAE